MEEEPQIETLVSFPPHRRRCLKSETHRILFRILSHCNDESQLPDQNVAPELNQDNGSNELGEATENEKERGGNVEMDEPDSAKRGDSAAGQELVGDERCDTDGLRERIEQLEDLLGEEGNEDFLGQMDAMDFGIDFRLLELGPEEMPMDELLDIEKGNDDSTPKLSAGAFVANDGVNGDQGQFDNSRRNATVGLEIEGESNECISALLKTNAVDVEPIIIQQKAMGTSVSSSGAEESLIPITKVAGFQGPEHTPQEVPGAFSFSLDKDMVGDASKPSESRGKSLSQIANDLEGEDEMQSKENQMEMVSTGNAPNHMNDGDLEEGEISDDDGMDDISTDMILYDTVRPEENNKVQLLKDVDDPREHSGKEATVKEFDSNSFLWSIADNAQNPRGEEPIESRTNPIGRPGVVWGETMEAIKEGGYDPVLECQRIEGEDSGIGRGIGYEEAWSNNQASDEKISENNEARSCGTPYEDKGDADAPHKKKRGPPSKEKKQRKKAKERKKRADMDRKLGVRRPKLHSIEKPKTVSICNHYKKGRCREGDKCKFSHDTVPITKSTKPCTYFARQSCMKGDNCEYDHQLSKYPCDQFVNNNGFCIRGVRCLFSHKIPSNEEGAVSKPESVPPPMQSSSRTAQVKIGSPFQTNALAHPPGTHSHNNTELNMARTLLEQPTMSMKGFSFLSAGTPSLVHSSMLKQGVSAPYRNTGARAGNLVQQSPSNFVPNTKENTMTSPSVVTPKGINFLSLGKASPDRYSGKNQDHHHSSQSVPETVQIFNAAPKVIQPAQPKTADVLCVPPVNHSSGGNPFSLTSTSDYDNRTGFGEGKSAFIKPQNSSAISSRFAPSPLTTGQSSDYTASRFKDTVNQRALFSTLAFAAKYESKETNQSIGSSFAQVDRETKQNDSGKAFNVLEYLSSIGSTTKQ